MCEAIYKVVFEMIDDEKGWVKTESLCHSYRLAELKLDVINKNNWYRNAKIVEIKF